MGGSENVISMRRPGRRGWVAILVGVVVAGLAACSSWPGHHPEARPEPGPGTPFTASGSSWADARPETGRSFGVASEEVALNPASKWELGGTLTIPTGGTPPYPAVVMVVPGPGELDQDYTTGTDGALRDTANYLTAHGIAVLRYASRPYTYPAQTAADRAGHTVKED
jgi:hypothetical protein